MQITKDVYMVGSGSIGLTNSMDCHIYLVDGGNACVKVGGEKIYGYVSVYNSTHTHGCKFWMKRSSQVLRFDFLEFLSREPLFPEKLNY